MFCSRDSYNNCAVWKFTELSDLTENGPIGSLRARFEVTKGPSSISTINVQFNCEGTTLSGVDLELQESGYRVSLVKKKFVSGTLSYTLSQELKLFFFLNNILYCRIKKWGSKSRSE